MPAHEPQPPVMIIHGILPTRNAEDRAVWTGPPPGAANPRLRNGNPKYPAIKTLTEVGRHNKG